MIQGRVSGSVFVDLFAGSGGIGIEALSRGARHAYFVERDREAVFCIQDNLSFTRFADRATVLKQDVSGALSLISEKEVDILFMDPPYRQGSLFRTFQTKICDRGYLGHRGGRTGKGV